MPGQLLGSFLLHLRDDLYLCRLPAVARLCNALHTGQVGVVTRECLVTKVPVRMSRSRFIRKLPGVCLMYKTNLIKPAFVLLFPEPIPALSSWQRDGLDSDEARLSPQAGRLIRQLLDEDSDPMLSPRFYAYGQSQQYLDDTEVPPSPPNSHSFMRWVVICQCRLSHAAAKGLHSCIKQHVFGSALPHWFLSLLTGNWYFIKSPL